MAKRKKQKKQKKGKRRNTGGLAVPQPLLRSLAKAAQTPMARLLLAEAMLHAGNALIRKPAAAGAVAGKAAAQAVEAAEAADSAFTIFDAAGRFLNAAAERLKAGIEPADAPTDGSDRKHLTNQAGGAPAEEARAPPGFDEDEVRTVLLGQHADKKAKAAKHR